MNVVLFFCSDFITDADKAKEYDHIIFDTAPTGHTLRMLHCHNNPWISIAETVIGRGNRAWQVYTRILMRLGVIMFKFNIDTSKHKKKYTLKISNILILIIILAIICFKLAMQL